MKPLGYKNDLLFAYSDPDPQVRAEAILKLEHLYARKRNALPRDVYPIIRELCANSSAKVRMSALRILERLAQHYPEFPVKNQRGHDVRTHDDAFTIVCHAINDLDVDVRAEAAALLRNFEIVSDKFLHQTLDKKLLPSMKRLKDGKASANVWSTGKKFNEAALDMPDDDDESTAIIPTNSCGAFITALEDEFMAVRIPAVRSLCALASTRPDFAYVAIDYVSDMFNDEMHEVRLLAIRELATLLTDIKLNESQLDSILSVLNDKTLDTRRALHDLLARVNFADAACIRQVLHQLKLSMQRFPNDKNSVYTCLSKIGRQHGFLIHALVPELFKIHPLFEPIEADINDVFYLTHFILAMNAAAVQAPLRPLIPQFALKHYQIMQPRMPDLIPLLGNDAGAFDTEQLNVVPSMLKGVS